MTTTLAPTAATTDTFETTSTTRSVLRTGLAVGALAAAATTAVVVVAEAVGVPMEPAEKTAPAGEHIPLYGYAMATAMSTAIGVVLAVALGRWAKRPARTFAVVATILTLVSFAFPHTTGHATVATRLVLDLTHVVAAAIVIPALARVLPNRR